MKKIFRLFIAILLTVALVACGNSDKQNSNKLAGIALPVTADEFFVHIGDTLEEAFKAEGFETQMTDAGSDFTLYVQQLETFVTKGVDVLYIFAAGEADLYEDVIADAKSKGIKTLVSHNVYPFEDATINIMADEFTMGVMMAPMVSKYLDRAYPNAEPHSVKALALEQSMLPEMVRRSAGMKIIGQKYLREIDMLDGKYVKKDGPADIKYLGLDGNLHDVDEPTGGLILDENGNAMLNPFYDERINIVEIANRDHQTNLDAQESLDNFLTSQNKDLRIVLNYGGDGAAGSSEKMLEFFNSGKLDAESLDQLAVFGADITDTNIQRIKDSFENASLVRGVMTNGNIVETISKYATLIAKGEDIPNESYERVGYAILDDNNEDIYQGLYDDELGDLELFFPN